MAEIIIGVKDKWARYRVIEREMLHHFKKALDHKECRNMDQINNTVALITQGNSSGQITGSALVSLARH